MRTTWIAGASALTLLATPALAQTNNIPGGLGGNSPTAAQRAPQPDPMKQEDISEIKGASVEESKSVRRAQSELKREGLYDGKVDGIAGPETKHGITAFQERKGLQQTGRLDRPTRDRLTLSALRMDSWSSETAQR
jgi:peptidoglycan hydrolase-like protein with peptidoglycan-binding domain